MIFFCIIAVVAAFFVAGADLTYLAFLSDLVIDVQVAKGAKEKAKAIITWFMFTIATVGITAAYLLYLATNAR